MSIKAMNWAMGQATGDPRAQCLLYVVADLADADGMCWPSADWMAQKSQQSRATVYRRLKNLQDMGLLVTFPRWIDSDGRIWNAASPGRRATSPEIRLQLGVVVTRASAPNDDDDGLESEQGSSQPETGVSHAETTPVAPVRQGSSHCSDSKNHYLNQEDSPQPPKGGLASEIEADQGSEWSGVDTWPAFKASWREPIPRESIARQVWSALTEAERERATTAAAGMHVWRGSQKKPPTPPSAQTFLREKDAWVDYAKHAPPPPGSMAGNVMPASSDIGRAIVAMHMIAGSSGVGVLQTSTGRMVRVSREVSPRVMALGAFVDVTGNRDEAKWPLIEPGTKPYFAWCEFIRDELGRQPAVSDVIVGRITKPEIDEQTGQPTGREVLDKLDRRKGFRAPSLWPPRVDGTFSNADPPHELSDEDARELSR